MQTPKSPPIAQIGHRTRNNDPWSRSSAKPSRGTEGSNPSPSSGESAANLVRTTRSPRPRDMRRWCSSGGRLDLARFIEAGPRALEAAQTALDYVFDQAQDKLGIRGERLVHELAGPAANRLTSNGAVIANAPRCCFISICLPFFVLRPICRAREGFETTGLARRLPCASR